MYRKKNREIQVEEIKISLEKYSEKGRPSIDPVSLFKIVFIQYLFGIRSMRQTIREIFDCYLCPQNQMLKYTTTNREGYRQYKSEARICQSCPCRRVAS